MLLNLSTTCTLMQLHSPVRLIEFTLKIVEADIVTSLSTDNSRLILFDVLSRVAWRLVRCLTLGDCI